MSLCIHNLCNIRKRQYRKSNYKKETGVRTLWNSQRKQEQGTITFCQQKNYSPLNKIPHLKSHWNPMETKWSFHLQHIWALVRTSSAPEGNISWRSSTNWNTSWTSEWTPKFDLQLLVNRKADSETWACSRCALWTSTSAAAQSKKSAVATCSRRAKDTGWPSQPSCDTMKPRKDALLAKLLLNSSVCFDEGAARQECATSMDTSEEKTGANVPITGAN